MAFDANPVVNQLRAEFINVKDGWSIYYTHNTFVRNVYEPLI